MVFLAVFVMTKSGGAADTLKTNAVVSAAASTGTNAAHASELDDKQRLAAGDRVSFRVTEDRSEPKPLIVTDSGELEIPHVGRVMARERTCRDLAQEIKSKLEEKYYYRATVILSVEALNRSRGNVYLFGEVRAPGSLAIPSEETLTLAKAIIRAGGFTDFADKHHVKVTRETVVLGKSGRVYEVDVARVLEKGQIHFDLKLEPGDMVFVPGRLVNF